MLHARYTKTETGWSRTTLAFECFAQWEARQGKHRPGSFNRRTRAKPMPPRNYSIWPVFEAVNR